ncbi:MAG: DUF4231 domain-containing protein [Nocardiopsaceae bacterium]|nr:DUF4231 domain-containing protein [Nocardiopsaceae bacterium]
MSDTSGSLEEYRRIARDYEQNLNRLKGVKALQRVYFAIAFISFILAVLLGYTVVMGLWNEQPVATRYISLALITCLLFGMLAAFWFNRKKLVDFDIETRNLAHDRQEMASKIALESVESLRIYREASLDLIQAYRQRAKHNRSIHNYFQAAIIILSALVSTFTALSGELPQLRWIVVTLSTIVTISAGLTAYFKFRERGYNLQSTADEIEKHYNAAEFRLDDYVDIDDEPRRLRIFAKHVEKLKEEQRKKELQLEQSPEKKDSGS